MKKNSTLKHDFEIIAERYRIDLCKQWDLDISDSWWIPSDRVGETLALCDLEFSISFEDVRLFVDNNISFEDFKEWWNYDMNAFDRGEHPINAWSWFVLGAKPKDLE